ARKGRENDCESDTREDGRREGETPVVPQSLRRSPGQTPSKQAAWGQHRSAEGSLRVFETLHGRARRQTRRAQWRSHEGVKGSNEARVYYGGLPLSRSLQ
ncbi:unnamed protein product, partial [Ectocarpus sp. 13 AM-2016]